MIWVVREDPARGAYYVEPKRRPKGARGMAFIDCGQNRTAAQLVCDALNDADARIISL